jgi:predicted ester cyclase
MYPLSEMTICSYHLLMVFYTLLIRGFLANLSFGASIPHDKAESTAPVQSINSWLTEVPEIIHTSQSSTPMEQGGYRSVLNVMADLMAGGQQPSYADEAPGANTIRAFVDAYNKRDAQAAARLTTNDFIRYSSTTSQPMNRNDWIRMWVGFDRAFPDERWDIRTLKVTGNKVTIEVVETGTFRKKWVLNDGHVIEPTGKGYMNNSTIVFTMDEEGRKIKSYQQTTGNGFLAVGIGMNDLIAIGKNGF